MSYERNVTQNRFFVKWKTCFVISVAENYNNLYDIASDIYDFSIMKLFAVITFRLQLVHASDDVVLNWIEIQSHDRHSSLR